MPSKTPKTPKTPKTLNPGKLLPWQIRAAVGHYNDALEAEGFLTRLVLTGSREDFGHAPSLYAFGVLGWQEPLAPATAKLADIHGLVMAAVRAEAEALPHLDYNYSSPRRRVAAAWTALGTLVGRMSQYLDELDARPSIEIPF